MMTFNKAPIIMHDLSGMAKGHEEGIAGNTVRSQVLTGELAILPTV